MAGWTRASHVSNQNMWFNGLTNQWQNVDSIVFKKKKLNKFTRVILDSKS